MKRVLFLILTFLSVFAFSQSAEEGSPFNQYMSADAGINPMSGTVAVSKTLATISAGDVQATFAMSYSGNVTQSVNNRNDVAPTGWLGLGWAMGFAKIVCDHNGSMTLIDDSYYLVTAEGSRYRIVKDRTGKWWISDLPYWKISPVIRNSVNYDGKKYDIIVGWNVTDDSGRKYVYGDMDDITAIRTGNVARKSTQFALCWPKTYGKVGLAEGGEAYPFPQTWNLKRMEDLKGNYLTFDYMQKSEKLAINDWKSSFGYTKECYLQSVTSSDGSKVVFSLKPKGEGEFVNEFLDVNGITELTENDADAFVDPMERYYLYKIEIFGKHDALMSTVEFCYGSLSLAPQGTKDSRYVKRLLKTVVFSNNQGEEYDRESYSYNTDASGDSPETNRPLGMLDTITGSNCGKVAFEYTYTHTKNATGVGLHTDEVVFSHPSTIGYLDDGTPYIVDIGNYLMVWVKISGWWKLLNDFYKYDDLERGDDSSEVYIGKDWFVYKKSSGKEALYTPFVWNGRTFVPQTPVDDPGSRTKVDVGDGYIVKSYIDEGKPSHIKLTIPWSVWGKQYGLDDFVDENGNVDNKLNAEDGSIDREKIRVFASPNHFGLFYLGPDYGNNGRFRIYTFNHDKTKLVKTYQEEDLDDDNIYIFSGDFLYAATEDAGLYGSNAEIFRWLEPSSKYSKAKWYRVNSWDLDGTKGTPSIEAHGSNYFVVKHDDYDAMSTFYWDGERWISQYKNKDMVGGIVLDLIQEAEWWGYSGNNFFLASEPYEHWMHVKVPYLVPKRWGFRKRHKRIPTWTSTDPRVYLERYEYRDGVWSNTGTERLNEDTLAENKFLLGTDWYIEKTSKKVFAWNGREWNSSTLDIDFGDDSKSLEGNSFHVHRKNSENTVYFKKSDGFDNDYGVYLVTKKTVIDPVLDKVVDYKYQWTLEDAGFDFLTNSPIIGSYTVFLPNGGGALKKKICSTDFNVQNYGDLYIGKICEEETINAIGLVTSSKKTYYERFDGDNLGWPGDIYLKRVSSVEMESGKLRSKDVYAYSDANGQISSVTSFLDGKTEPEKQKTISYAAEYNQDMFAANRLTEERIVLECRGSCDKPQPDVVKGNFSRYKKVSGYNVVQDVWSYTKMNEKKSFDLDTNNWTLKDWELEAEYTEYRNYRAVESRDRLGIKASAFYENKNDGVLFGNVINAGYNESFVVPGVPEDTDKEDIEHDLSIRGFSYNIIPLKCGSVIDRYDHKVLGKENPKCPTQAGSAVEADDDLNYGRFAGNAIKVDGNKTLKGAVTPEKGKKYVFSAWVQGVNASGKAYLYMDNNYSVPAKEWNLTGSGTWEPIEFELSLTPTKHNFELKGDNGNTLRVQNVIFIPSNASANVTYWDKFHNKPVVSVNDRGIGAFSVLDANGRVTQTFTEDNSGNIVKVSETKYRTASCVDNTSSYGRLLELSINGNPVIGVNSSFSLDYVVPNETSEINVHWQTRQNGEKVRYAFVEANKTVTEWKSSCCNTLLDASLSLDDVDNWQLLVDVFPFDDHLYYTINISRLNSGWVDYGTPRSNGSLPVFVSPSNPAYMYYMTNKGIVSAHFDGNDWTETSNQYSVTFDFLKSASNGTQAYVMAKPDVGLESWIEVLNPGTSAETRVRRYANSTGIAYSGFSTLSSKGNVGMNGEMTNNYGIAVDGNSVPYVLYQKSTRTEDPKIHRDDPPPAGSVKSNLVVKKYVSGHWLSVGNSLRIDEDNNSFVVEPEIVSDYAVKDADIAIGKDGYIYIAYIGAISNYAGTEENGTKTVLPHFVVIKRLYPEKSIDNSVNVPVWAGPTKIQDVGSSSDMLPNLDGDIVEVPSGSDDVPITTAARVKLAQGKNGMYLAVLYQVAMDGESEPELSKSKLAVSVFKAEKRNTVFVDDDGVSSPMEEYKFVPLLDNSVSSTIYSRSLEEEQRIVAYLDDSDPFDFVVHDDTPYIMFANAANDDRLTVIKYNGSRWLSVGNPAFAFPQNAKDAASLSVDNSAEPYVAFRENSVSANISRRNLVVPQKYVAKDDVDKTLLSLGNVTGTSVGSEFRQYILNYSAVVAEDLSDITIVPELRSPDDVCAVVIQNGSKYSITWSTNNNSKCTMATMLPGVVPAFSQGSPAPSLSIPIDPGDNNLKIRVYGVNGDFLTYSVSIKRPRVADDALEVFDESTEMRKVNEIKKIDGSEEITYISEGNSPTRRICFQFNSFWKLIFNGQSFYMNTCLDVTFGNLCSDSDYQEARLEDEKGNVKVIKIKDGSCKQNKLTSSSSGKSSSSGTSASSGGSGTSASSGGSGTSASSSSKAKSSSSSKYSGVPGEYSSLVGYKVFASGNLNISDRVKFLGGTYGCSNVNVGANANVKGELRVKNNAELRSNSYTEKLVVGGNVNKQQGARVGTLTRQTPSLPSLTQKNVSYGSSNIVVGNNTTKVLQPGTYKQLHVFSGANVSFEGGEYRFESFVIEPDVRLTFKNSSTPVRIWVQGNLSFGDRTQVSSSSTNSKLFIYTNAYNIYMGVTSSMHAILVAPKASINIASGYTFSGQIWAKEITIQPDATIK